MGGPQGDRPASGTSRHRHAARRRGSDPALVDAGRFLDYELDERIALGAVGETFRARDTRVGSPVALKLLPVEAGSDRDFVHRFEHEMPVLAALDEPHLLPIHDFGFQGGRLYLAMPVVEGADLGTLLRSTGTLPPGRALAIVEQVAGALDAVHAAGLVHGHVSTATIHVAPRDVAYLVDAGLIPLVGVTPTSLTADAARGATLACVAPERLTGRPVDGRSDVYSLACVLVECLTGAPPYEVDDLPSLVSAHLYRDAPGELLDGVPPALRDVLQRGLAKRPEDRFATAGEFVAAVRLALADEEGERPRDEDPLLAAPPPVAAPPPPQRAERRRVPPVAAVVLAALAVLAVVAALVVVSRDDPRVEATSSDRTPTGSGVPSSQVATGTAGHHHTSEASTAPAAPAESVAEPRIERQVKVGRAPHEVAVAPDGRSAYVADPGAGKVYVWDVAKQEPSSSIPIPQGPPQMVSLSPDGDRLYVSVFDEGYTVNAVVVVDTAAREVVRSVPVGKGPYAAETTPDGTLLYVPLFEEPFVDVVDTRSGKRVARVEGAANPHWMAFAEDGSVAYTANHFSDVVTVLDLRSNRPLREIPVGDGPHCVELSPDGSRLAVADYIGGDVSIIDTARNVVVKTVANVGAGPQDVTYAPDGRHLYTANVDDGTVSVIDTETYEVTDRIRTGKSPTSVAALPDGTAALVSNFENGTVTVLQTAAS